MIFRFDKTGYGDWDDSDGCDGGCRPCGFHGLGRWAGMSAAMAGGAGLGMAASMVGLGMAASMIGLGMAASSNGATGCLCSGMLHPACK